ncbi:MAG: hypothetical protein Q8N04_04275 [Nitrospira sp.]|nr:hypothetical protein [Nitrospira sp.]
MTLLKALSINGVAFNEVAFDSAKVDVRVSLVHKIETPGTYSCWVVDEYGKGRRFQIIVTEATGQDQTLVDCDELFDPQWIIKDVTLSREDYLVFVSMTGASQYVIEIVTTDDPPQVAFDSKNVGSNSVIVIAPYLPGTYTIKDEHSGAAATLNVLPLEARFQDAMSDEAVAFYHRIQEEGALNVTLDGNGFSPNPIELDADRPMAIQGSGPMRIVGRVSEMHPLVSAAW